MGLYSNKIELQESGGLNFKPKKPSPRPPLPRMVTPEIKITKSRKSRTPVPDPESEGNASGSDLEDSPERARSYSPTNGSPILRKSNRASPVTPNRNKSRKNGGFTPENLMTSRTPGKKQFQGGGHNYLCLICIGGLTIIAIILGTLGTDAFNMSNLIDKVSGPALNKEELISEALSNLRKNIADIEATFKEQYSTTWRDLESGISDVVKKRSKPAIFLLFSTKEDTMFCLANMIANASKSALGSAENLVLSPEDLGNDYGMALTKLTDQIKQQKVVVCITEFRELLY